MYIYENDASMRDICCLGSYSLFICVNRLEDQIITEIMSSDKIEEYFVNFMFKNPEFGKRDDVYYRDSFYVSIERPIYIQKPPRVLTKEEKILLNEYTDKYWMDIVKRSRLCCYDNCFEFGDRMCCNKFRNRPIPLIHPDYTLLDERKDV